MAWPKVPLVEILWRDAQSHAGWHTHEELHEILEQEDRAHCRTVGWLVYEDETVMVVAQHITVVDNIGEIMEIPWGTIISITVLRDADDSDADSDDAEKEEEEDCHDEQGICEDCRRAKKRKEINKYGHIKV